MSVVIGVLRFACVVLFTLSIPITMRRRYRTPGLPVWLLILLSVAVGWVCPFAHKALERPLHQAFDREERLAAEEYMRHPPPPITHEDGSVETAVDNPYGISEWPSEEYHPIESLLYGPAYLAICWAAAWVFFCRSPLETRRRILLIAVGLLLIFWVAVIVYGVHPPAIFNDGILVNGWNPFFGPQLTLPLALLGAWLLGGWLPGVIARELRRVGNHDP